MKVQITKREWYDRGGFANPALFRKADRLGRWRHFIDTSR
jgi:hypothetical protein